MKKANLGTLKCIKTEDWAGGDEFRVEVFADEVLQSPLLRHNLNDNQRWAISKSYRFRTTLTVKLWDEDSPDIA